MNKFILAVDGLNLSSTSIDYAIYFAREFNGHVVAVLLKDLGYHSSRADFGESELEQLSEAIIEADIIDDIDKKRAIESELMLRKRFEASGVRYSIHYDPQIALQALLFESSLGDVLIVDQSTCFSNTPVSQPSPFLQQLLAGARCPVILTPPVFRQLNKIVLAYDDKASSTFAIRQFSYLFPETEDMVYELVHSSRSDDPGLTLQSHLLQEMLCCKYENLIHKTLPDGDARSALLQYMLSQKSACMLVLGAYDRSSVSRWLDPSIADCMIQQLKMPLFIAHP